jgi:hypothetical protein
MPRVRKDTPTHMCLFLCAGAYKSALRTVEDGVDGPSDGHDGAVEVLAVAIELQLYVVVRARLRTGKSRRRGAG